MGVLPEFRARVICVSVGIMRQNVLLKLIHLWPFE